MPRPKPATDGAVNIHDPALDICPLYPPERMDAILRLFKPGPESFDREKTAAAIKKAAMLFNFAIMSRRRRPTSGQKKAALKQLATHLGKAKELLDSIPREDVANVAAKAGRQLGEELILTVRDDGQLILKDSLDTRPWVVGARRCIRAAFTLETLHRWVVAAEEALEPDEPGRNRFDEERGFVEMLRDLWRDAIPRPPQGAKKKPPLQADFLAFVKAAASPVCEQHGYSPKLTNICQELVW